MTAIPIDPSFAVSGADWKVAPVDGPVQDTGGASFSGALGKAVSGLQADQTAAAEASKALATGTATDQTSAVMALERARLSMQLASQIRTKAVEAFSDVMRTQV